MKDQEGNVKEWTYNKAGLETMLTFSTIVTGFDERVYRAGTSYTDLGQVERKWQEDDGQEIIDDTMKYYDGWRNLTRFVQDVDSEIGADTGRDDFEIEYTYTKATPTGGRPMVRRTGMTSSAGADITYEFLSTGNLLDDAAGRVTRMKQDTVVTATYEYLGVGDVVGTALPEPDYFSNVYDGTGKYTGVDNWGRPVNNIWQRNTGNMGNPTPHFFDIDIAWDEGSNITSIVDNVHVLRNAGGSVVNNLFDAKATNDPLRRLLRLEEGHFNAGTNAITVLEREERWQDGSGNSKLNQTGNKLLHYRDLDGNGSGTGTDEFNDTRTYSDANELLTRDTDSSGGAADFTLVYDAVGNEIDDGIYKKTYDPIGRLTTVKNQSDALVASYTYNAYGYLTTRHYDINLAGGVTSADPKICILYDEKWRPRGTFRYDSTIALNAGKDEPAAEMFDYHTAGLGGYGGSSKLDAVLMRAGHDPEDWGTESAEEFSYIIYMMDDWRGDVVFVVKANGEVLEWVHYLASGTPSRKAKGDVYSDGDVTIDDVSRLVDWWNASAYDVRADINGDGTVDGDDYALLELGFWGHEVLSAVGNRFGYAGYQHASELAGAMYLARNRFYNATTGRFPTRDRHPTPYFDGMNLYQYARGMPLVAWDPMGLASSTWGLRAVGGCSTHGTDFTGGGNLTSCGSNDPTYEPGITVPYPTYPCGNSTRRALCRNWAVNRCNRQGGCSVPSCCNQCIEAATACCESCGTANECATSGMRAMAKCHERNIPRNPSGPCIRASTNSADCRACCDEWRATLFAECAVGCLAAIPAGGPAGYAVCLGICMGLVEVAHSACEVACDNYTWGPPYIPGGGSTTSGTE